MKNKWSIYIIPVILVILMGALLIINTFIFSNEDPHKTFSVFNSSTGRNSHQLAESAYFLKEMFPELTFEKKGRFYAAGERNTYYVDSIRPGSFTGPDRDEVLVTVRRPINEPSHNEGFYQAYMAVFENKSGKLLTSVQNFSADEGDYGLFPYQERLLVFFAGNKTYQGWTDWDAALWQAGEKWEKIWPSDPEYWKDKLPQINDTGFDLFERKITVPANETKIMPDYTWEFSKKYYWNAENGEFIEQ